MRWGRRATDRPSPLLLTVAVVTAPVWLIVGIFLFVALKIEKVKRHLLGPSETWRPWFAWFPVREDEGMGRWVWLEWVERRATRSGFATHRLPLMEDAR